MGAVCCVKTESEAQTSLELENTVYLPNLQLQFTNKNPNSLRADAIIIDIDSDLSMDRVKYFTSLKKSTAIHLKQQIRKQNPTGPVPGQAFLYKTQMNPEVRIPNLIFLCAPLWKSNSTTPLLVKSLESALNRLAQEKGCSTAVLAPLRAELGVPAEIYFKEIVALLKSGEYSGLKKLIFYQENETQRNKYYHLAQEMNAGRLSAGISIDGRSVFSQNP